MRALKVLFFLFIGASLVRCNSTSTESRSSSSVTYSQAEDFMQKRCDDIGQTLMKSTTVEFNGTKLYMFLSVAENGDACISSVSENALEVIATDCGSPELKIEQWNALGSTNNESANSGNSNPYGFPSSGNKQKLSVEDSKPSVTVNLEEFTFSKDNLGKLTNRTTKEDLSQLFPEAKIIDKVVYSFEGIDVYGTSVEFDDPKKNFTIQWSEGTSIPSVVQITESNSYWHTKDGLTIGSTLTQVEEVNGTTFSIYGFGVDSYIAGSVIDWNSGRLQGLNFQFDTKSKLNPEDEMQIMGDGGIESSNSVLQKSGFKVQTISIYFPSSN